MAAVTRLRRQSQRQSGKHKIKIRDAGPADREAVRRATLSAYEEYAAIVPEIWEDYRQDIIATLADPNPAAQIVAEMDGGIVGAVLLYPAGTVFAPEEDLTALEFPEVRLLAVVPAARRRGVGRALMEECVRRARHSGAAALTLHTTDMMETALRMYERMGFVRDPDRDFSVDAQMVVKAFRLPLKEEKNANKMLEGKRRKKS